MSPADKVEFEKLPNSRARAQWLLQWGVTAKPDIDPQTLSLIWRTFAAGVMLPGKYTGTEAEAIRDATAWLTFKTTEI